MIRPTTLRDLGPTREEIARDGFDRDFPWLLLAGLLAGPWLLGLSYGRALFAAFGLRRSDIDLGWGEPLSRGLGLLTDWRIGGAALIVALVFALLLAGRRRSKAGTGVLMSVLAVVLLLCASLAGGTWLGREHARRIASGVPGAAPAVRCDVLSTAVNGAGRVADALGGGAEGAPLRLLARSASALVLVAPPEGEEAQGRGDVIVLPSERVAGCRVSGEGSAGGLLASPPLYWRQ